MSRSRAPIVTAAVAALLAAAPLAAATTATAAAPRGVHPAAASGGTSGYAAEGGRFTSVTAAWTQVAVTCSSATQQLSVWVGLDGVGDSTLEQAGTSTACSGGVPVMNAWYELYPAAPVRFADPVSAGDRMSASVTTDGAGNFTLTVSDTTRGWTGTARRALAGAALSSAEVMTQTSGSGGGGTGVGGAVLASFTGATANGRALGGLSPVRFQAPGTVVSAFTGGGEAFTVTRGPAA